MKWYQVIKKIAGKPYLYMQRTYREGGKVRTQSQYIGAIDEQRDWIPKKRLRSPSIGNSTLANNLEKPISGSEQTHNDWVNNSNPFWPEKRPFKIEKAKNSIKRSAVSVSAMKAEYARVLKHLEKLGLDAKLFASISLLEGEKATWHRKKKSYEITLAADKKGSGRNRFKRTYRMALAHAFLDSIETQSPTLYDRLRTVMDLSWFNTKMVVAEHIFRSSENHKAWITLQFLWSGSLPRSLEQQLGKRGYQKLQPYMPGTWRDEAAELIADVIHRGYKPSISRLSKDRAKAKASAKRALNVYRKLGPIERFTAKGRKKWKIYKKHEARFLLVNHRKSRLKMLMPFLGDFHR